MGKKQEGKQERKYPEDKNFWVVDREEIIKTFEWMKSVSVEESQQRDNKENH